jgi:hypothetical protein
VRFPDAAWKRSRFRRSALASRCSRCASATGTSAATGFPRERIAIRVPRETSFNIAEKCRFAPGQQGKSSAHRLPRLPGNGMPVNAATNQARDCFID